MAASKKSSTKKRSSSKRDTVNAPNATFYTTRTAGGQFKEMDEKGKSLRADRAVKAKKKVASGFGDQGDRKKSAKKK